MEKNDFHKLFKTVGPVILPVIHVLSSEQAVRNAKVAIAEGAQGVFLINHDFPHHDLLPMIEEVRRELPSLWIGVNFLGVSGREAFPILADLASGGTLVDAYWADDACLDEHAAQQSEADEIARVRARCRWDGFYFGGTAFKKQRDVAPEDHERSASMATKYMDVVTTSGVATGKAADLAKIDAFAKGCGDTALALASGITPENAHLYAPHIDAMLVATGINHEGDFYNIDPVRLGALMRSVRSVAAGITTPSHDDAPSDGRGDRWYLYNMAPTEREGIATWLDPSSAYVNATSFNAILDDLLRPFNRHDIDVVAAPDAMGFILGSAMAARLGKGFLAIRKAGKLPVNTDAATFTNYTGRTQDLEMRAPAFKPGTRVLLVDQWIETGGTMRAAIELVERQGGVVAGIAAVCLEETHGAEAYRERYLCSTAVLPETELQRQFNSKAPDHFPNYRVEKIFPDID